MAGGITAPSATMHVEAELRGDSLAAQFVGFHIPAPTDAILRDDHAYQINMCLTPRPLNTRAGYCQRWGPHRFESLGDIILIPPREELRIKGGTGDQSSLTCQLDAAAVQAVLGHHPLWSTERLAAALNITNARVRTLLVRIAEEVRHPGFGADRMLNLLGGELAIEVARFCLATEDAPPVGGLASWRLRLIDERMGSALKAPKLAELAQACNVSVRQLTRGFRVSRGCSIGDYIEQRRMENAKRMLMAGKSVKQIAFAMGFASPSSFTFAFRRAVGSSPSIFRQRQAQIPSVD